MEYRYACNKSKENLNFLSKPATSGRVSPCHDLGYHTLLTRVVPTYEWYPNSTPAAPVVPRFTPTFKAKKQPKTSQFDRLSDVLITRIFSHLSSNHLCICARVCRRWYFLAWEPQLWTSISLNSDRIHVDRGLKTLFRLLCRHSPTGCLAVEKINLNGCGRLTDKGLLTLARRCPELKTFLIRGCNEVTINGVTEILSRCLKLEKLDVTGCFRITAIQSLSRIRQNDSGSDTESLLPVGLYLQYLDLTDCHCIDDAGLEATVRHCPQLTHLYLRRCVQITDAGIKYVASYCSAMRELSISDCLQITDFGLYELAKLGPSLRYLSVAKCDQVSDAGVKQIARHCYKLRYLNVRGCEAVSDNSVEVLARSCPRLRALDVGKCDVTDQGLKMLSENCPNLKKLSVKSCDLITDRGIQFIAYYCRGLQQLNIQDCPVTVEGYRKVRKLCKRCIIEHTNPGFY
ncbi:F-box/LRR-repeat protein 7-like [Centruroides vittatus]|uniref:F-box/LRR-repeat protein 7-like n=1 Tax=Centruroides vittatus TaxID=120091 RepID=UPI0035109E18